MKRALLALLFSVAASATSDSLLPLLSTSTAGVEVIGAGMLHYDRRWLVVLGGKSLLSDAQSLAAKWGERVKIIPSSLYQDLPPGLQLVVAAKTSTGEAAAKALLGSFRKDAPEAYVKFSGEWRPPGGLYGTPLRDVGGIRNPEERRTLDKWRAARAAEVFTVPGAKHEIISVGRAVEGGKVWLKIQEKLFSTSDCQEGERRIALTKGLYDHEEASSYRGCSSGGK